MKKLLTFFLLLCFYACYKSTSDDAIVNLPTEKTVKASIQGKVVDENGDPVAGAAISSGTASTSTDANGVFSFSKINLSSRFGYVKAVKAGYFPGSRSVVTQEGGSSFVTIRLIPRTVKGSFAAASGGAVAVETGDTVFFVGASFVKAADGTAYTGSVKVYASYLDPTDKGLSTFMPGDLRGIGSDGQETGMQSFGMMAVELEGSGGEKLQLGASGKKATLKMNIPSTLADKAPTSIPLWYFNDSTGRWMQEGAAVRQGNSYVGEVSHFTYWNCDLAAGVVNFKVKVKDQHGNAMAYTQIQFKTTSFGVRGGYTDSAGFASGMIPRGEAMEFQVLSPCDAVLFGEQLGPVLADQDLGVVTVTYQPGAVTLTGKVVDCNGASVENGFVNALLDGLNYRALVSKGTFALTISRCVSTATDVKIVAGDYKTAQQGTVGTISVTIGNADAGTLTACGTMSEETVTFTFNGKTYTILAPPDSTIIKKTDTLYILGAWTKDASSTFIMELDNLTKPGNYMVHWLTLDNGEQYNCIPRKEMCKVTKVESTYGYIEGSFTATMYKIGDSLYKTPYPASGSFRFKRTY